MVRPVALAALAVLAVPLTMPEARADNPYAPPTKQQNVFDGPGERPKSVLDATNPLELMNQLRRSSAMDNATPPGDAIDRALREMEAQPTPGSAGVKGP
ncbi:hypothetical protein KBZ19_01805 [Synechococcus sp. L2F]|jgi:hypothetical protein|uniref:hypothetical protein n=1 Tax=Synechococcus sp. L2F TaxID=2823739 RepID=UPI0020CCD6C8|nr:hypothetical protein [Synechococcus sp. L2F]MCP9827227.1 hypothetical protein [Synechococcus sp. L2F]